jgi:hypothetical protein
MSLITNFDSEIRARIDAFAAELGTLVRRSAVDAVRGALGDGTAAPRRRGPGRPRKAAAPAKRGPGRPPKASKAPRARRGQPSRLSPEVVAKTAELVHAHVQANPGQRMEEISAALRIPTADLTAATTRLLAEGRVRREGQRRGTRYFAGGSRGGKKSGGWKTAKKAARGTRRKARRTRKKTRREPRGGRPLSAAASLERIAFRTPVPTYGLLEGPLLSAFVRYCPLDGRPGFDPTINLSCLLA